MSALYGRLAVLPTTALAMASAVPLFGVVAIGVGIHHLRTRRTHL